MATVPPELLSALQAAVPPEQIIASGDLLETLSKDYYWYSPVLKRQLDDKRADVVVRPTSLDQLKAVVSVCARFQVPVVPRGAGTGNYGQAIPLHGGVVVDVSGFNRILSIADGVVRCEPGARLLTIEVQARAAGWELRCLPSTWVKATLGGFFCGGSGGIGSIRWGGINAPGNVKAVTVLTCETAPRLVRLEEEQSLKALHTYGTTGIMVEIEMRLAPRIDYRQFIFSHPEWSVLLDWTDRFARNAAWRKRLVAGFESPIPSYFKPLKKYLRPDEAAALVLVDEAQAADLARDATEAGLATVFDRPLSDPPKPPFITDYTWNHTTLWAMQSDPTFTYLQAGFGANFREQIAELHQRFPGELLFHLEWTAGNAKLADNPGGRVVVGGIPLVRFRSEERLNEIIQTCRDLGVFIANPHTFLLEEGGRHPNIEDKRAFKAEVDPLTLLNPGKMKTYPNPFASAPAQA